MTGRYVRIELPGKQRTLTLAEVEVYSDGKNVARKGKATQSSTAHGGDASRAIDGNKSGTYGDGGQTHTQEGNDNPWWEVDLGRECPIESIVIYNRTDGDLGTRLNGFTLRCSTRNRNVVFEKDEEPDAGGEGGVRGRRGSRRSGSSAGPRCSALTSVRGQEADDVQGASRSSSQDDADRRAAVQALLRIPPASWPKDEAKPLLDA